eukprot:scaffold10.g2457.t1
MGGVWVKDKQASDSMDVACSLMRLSGLVRAAVGLIKGLEIRITPGQFEMAVLSGILWFKIRERYHTSGEARQLGRRDLRRGKHTGRVELRRAESASDGCGAAGGSSGALATAGRLPAVLLSYEWGEPMGGAGSDLFCCPEPGLLPELEVQRATRSADPMETTTAAPPKEQAEQELGAEAWAALAATMSGVWLKDKQVSDSMDPVCSLMQLSTLVRAAVGLIKGLEIKITPEQFDLSVLSGILWFKAGLIRESYPTSGEPRQVGRRDMRRGKHTGHVELRHASGAGGATDGSSGASGNLPALALSYERACAGGRHVAGAPADLPPAAWQRVARSLSGPLDEVATCCVSRAACLGVTRHRAAALDDELAGLLAARGGGSSSGGDGSGTAAGGGGPGAGRSGGLESVPSAAAPGFCWALPAGGGAGGEARLLAHGPPPGEGRDGDAGGEPQQWERAKAAAAAWAWLRATARADPPLPREARGLLRERRGERGYIFSPEAAGRGRGRGRGGVAGRTSGGRGGRGRLSASPAASSS